MERSDVASACSVPLVVFKELQVLINELNLGLTAAIWVTAGVFSEEHRKSETTLKELKISVNKSKSGHRKPTKEAAGNLVKKKSDRSQCRDGTQVGEI